jgi:hypothetical protein
MPIIRIEASFGSSAFGVNTETVYSCRREAGVVMASLSDFRVYQPCELFLIAVTQAQSPESAK